MTPEFKYLMRLLASAARGSTAAAPDSAVDWQRLFRLAKEQTVQHLAAYAISQAPGLPCPADLRQEMQRRMRSAAISNALRRDGIMALLQEMKAAGFAPVLIKGFALADFYAVPECRISADTDVWIKPEFEKPAYEFLESKGFTVAPRWKNGHHAECCHPQLGILELHTQLYDEIVEEIWFDNMDGREFVIEAPIHVEAANGCYDTLGHTDNLIFLTLHMVKHFIQGGNSLRMMMDVALFYQKNRNQIDSQRFWSTLSNLKYDALVNCVFWAMIRYCAFSPSDFPGICVQCPDQLEAILDDLEKGGWLGFNEKEARKDGLYEYNRQMLLRNKSPLQYKLYMLWWRCGSLKLFFPSRKEMAKRYSYVAKHPWLLPAAWLHRLFGRGLRVLLKGGATQGIISESSILTESSRTRIDLFHRLGMI